MMHSTTIAGLNNPAVGVFVLPSMKISGGVQEAVFLAADLTRRGVRVEILSLWLSAHPIPVSALPMATLSQWSTRARRVPLQLPLLMLRFAHWMRQRFAPRQRGQVQLIFTHYSTLPLALLVARRQRWVFVQDLEWKFLAAPVLGRLLRAVILFLYRRCRLIAANDYLKSELQQLGLIVEAQAPIWANQAFIATGADARDIDLVMVLRKGAHKRLDLYLALLQMLRTHGAAPNVAIITTEDQIASLALSKQCWLRPDVPTMRSIYARARCFVHLSEHEGFGLPPLEAMAAGCVPYCRDSGGIRAYMLGELRELVVPISRPIKAITQDLLVLLGDAPRLARLSDVARAVFQIGLARATERGAQLSAHLAANAAATTR